MTMDKVLEVYKGTDKEMKCYGEYQYEIGKQETDTGAIRCGDKGYHSCEIPFDVLRYFPMRDGNRYFIAEASGIIDRTNENDSKIASSELKIKAEIGITGLIKAQIAYTKRKAKSGTNGGYCSNLAGGNDSNLAGGNYSNLVGGDGSNLAGGDRSNLAGGDRSNLAVGNGSNLAGGDRSNLAGGNWSNLAGGDYSNLVGGDGSNLAGGDYSNLVGGDGSNLAGGNDSHLAGGYSSLIIGGNGCRAKGGKNSVIVLTEWEWRNDKYMPVSVKTEIVDGERIKADTWYELKDGEIKECREEE